MTRGTPIWDSWVTHYDSAGQAQSMVTSFNEGKTVLSLLFDRIELSLQDNDERLAASVVLAGHFPITLPDNFPFRGFVVTSIGKGAKSFGAGAALTVCAGRSTRTFEWPPTSKVIDVSKGGSGEPIETSEFDVQLEMFAGEDFVAVGNPPKFPLAPLTLAIGLHARRPSKEDFILMNLSGIDIMMVSPG
jgi:hypothetical protein